MATRSMIGVRRPDGKVEAIYCHWDGYLDHNGRILLHHYTDLEKVKALIALGDLSSLGPEIGEEHDFDGPYNKDICISFCGFYKLIMHWSNYI